MFDFLGKGMCCPGLTYNFYTSHPLLSPVIVTHILKNNNNIKLFSPFKIKHKFQCALELISKCGVNFANRYFCICIRYFIRIYF